MIRPAARGSTLNILAVSYFYPPMTKPRAIQVSRLLSACGGRRLVVCGSSGDASGLGATAEDLETVPVPWDVPRGRRSVQRLLDRFGGSLAATWEAYSPWKRSVLETVRRTLAARDFKPDVVVTFGHPWIDHEIGVTLKREFEIPLITHFSDPWVDNPLVGPQSNAARAGLRKRESAVLQAADSIIFTSQETIDLVMPNYPAHLYERAVVLPHAFDPSLFVSDAEAERKAIRCLGSFYGERQPNALFRALTTLRRERPEVLGDYRFELIGNFHRTDFDAEAESYGVVSRPPVPYLESLRLMSSAAGLFLVDAPYEKSVFLPSKLIEYIGAGRPVFGITPSGTADRLIRRYGGLTANPADPDAVASMLADFLTTLPNRRIDESVRSEFEIRNVGQQFDRIIESCVSSDAVRRVDDAAG